MLESRISAGATEKFPIRASGKPDAETISSWSYDMEGHAKKCVERYCELANKTTQQLYKVVTHAWVTINLKKKMGQQENCLQFAHKIVLKCLYLARTERLDILWSVNKLARAVTRRMKSCDKRLARLISYIHHTSEYREILLCGKHNTTIQNCFKTLILQETLKTQNRRQVNSISWMCK